MHHLRLFTAVAFGLVAGGFVVAGERRALVIGNQAYVSLPPGWSRLSHAIPDAIKITQSLRAAGFRVEPVENADIDRLLSVIDQYLDSLHEQDWAFVYFSGHGVEVSHDSWLLPVDYRETTAGELHARGYPVSRLVTRVSQRSRAAVVVIDACRNDPFRVRATDVSRRFPDNVLLAWSTASGSPSPDTGTYADHLSRGITTPGKTVDQIFQFISSGVRAASDGAQQPSHAGSPALLATMWQQDSPALLQKGQAVKGCRPDELTPRPGASEGDLIRSAECNFMEKRYPRAKLQAEQAMRLNKGNPKTWYLLSKSQFELGARKEALTSITQACSLAPENPEYLFTSGAMNLDMQNFEQAVSQLRGAFSMAEERTDICQKYADALDKTSNSRLAAQLRAEACRKPQE